MEDQENHEEKLDQNEDLMTTNRGKTKKKKNVTSQCKHCGKNFCRPSYLKIHIEAVHEQLKKYHCKVCNKSLMGQGNLTRHIADIHNGVKNQKCNTLAMGKSAKSGGIS